MSPLAVTMGDPAGCGPLITIDTWRRRDELGLSPFFIVGDPRLFADQIDIEEIKDPTEAVNAFTTHLPVYPIEIDSFDKLRPGVPLPDSAPAIIQSIKVATELALSGQACAVVTNPISKSVLYEAGFEHPGHTEYIADLCSAATETPIHPVMMLVGGGLRVSLATIHVPLLSILEHLRPDILLKIARTTHSALQTDFAVDTPRLAFTGLNPHAGESGTIGMEEQTLINPVAEQLRSEGIDISDARSADTVFAEALNGQFDAVIAMTHDQGLIPVKTLDMWGGVNTTLGLPIIRTSPDHGTAFDAAALGKCRPDSLIAALKLAQSVVSNRAKS